MISKEIRDDNNYTKNGEEVEGGNIEFRGLGFVCERGK